MRRTLITGPFLFLTILGSACASQAELDVAQEEIVSPKAQLAGAQDETTALRIQVSSLSQPIVSGGGTTLTLMPDSSEEPTVELLGVFSFDRDHAFSRVETNPTAFVMPTHEMGDVAVPANEFSLAINVTAIHAVDVSTTADGTRKVIMDAGSIDCGTQFGTVAVTLNSHTAVEPSGFQIIAIDGGPGGGQAGDHFAFTVFFNKAEAPVNYAIFGPYFNFTGEMVAGEISITDPRAP